VSREETNDPDSPEFNETLREIFRDLKRGASSCPPVEELEKLVTGEASPDDRRQLENHILTCGICDHLVEQFKKFDEHMDMEGPNSAPAHWDEVDRRLTKRKEVFLKSRTPPRVRPAMSIHLKAPPPLERIFRFFKRPIVAYAITLILCYPAYRGVLSGPKLPEPVPPSHPQLVATKPPEPALAVQAPRVFDLNALRGSSQLSDSLQLTDRDNVFAVSFFVPVRPKWRYIAKITNESGSSAGTEQVLPNQDTGNFILMCDRRSFPSGTYQLAVQETDLQTGHTSHTIVFRFRL